MRIWKLSNAGLSASTSITSCAELLRQLLESRDALVLDDFLPVAHSFTAPWRPALKSAGLIEEDGSGTRPTPDGIAAFAAFASCDAR